MNDAIRFHPSSVDDAEAAVEWYAERSGRAAALFISELEDVIDRIAAHPGEFPRGEDHTRHAVLRRFPYLVVFRELAGGIEIVAVAHGHRRPGYWRDRLT